MCPWELPSDNFIIFNGVWTWSASTRIAGYTFTNSHVMCTNLHRLKQGQIWHSSVHSARAAGPSSPGAAVLDHAPLLLGESCPTDMHRSANYCRDRVRTCEKIGIAPSQPPFPHLLQRLLLYRHRTAKLLGVQLQSMRLENQKLQTASNLLCRGEGRSWVKFGFASSVPKRTGILKPEAWTPLLSHSSSSKNSHKNKLC